MGTRLQQSAVAKRAQQSMSDAATLLASRIAAGGCVVTAARKVAFDHIVLYSCAMRRFQLEAAKRNVTAALREELSCRSYTQASWEAAQSTSSTNKWLLREEETERRGASAKRSLSEEVVQQRKVDRPSIHPSIHFIHSFIHPSIHPFVRRFTGSIMHGSMDSLIHNSLVH